MKRKIGEIYNKPIVTGDKNLVTKNEVHTNDVSEFLGKDLGDMIYIGLKEPIVVDTDYDNAHPFIQQLVDNSFGCKFSNNKYYYAYSDYASDIWDKELCLAVVIPKRPKISRNPLDVPHYETYEEFINYISINVGIPVEELNALIFPISKKEFFHEESDYLELHINNHYIKVDFGNDTFTFDDYTGSITDESVDNRLYFVQRLGNIGVSFNDVVAKDVKYVTSTNNYIEYYNRFSSDVYYNGRVKTNGIGPDLNYGEVSSADGYRHSSGLIVAILE